MDPRQALADTNDRKNAVLDRKPRHEKPMFYDLGQKTLDYEEFRGRIISKKELHKVASNYTYALFGVGKLDSGGTTNGGRAKDYKCSCCDLKIRLYRLTNDVSDVAEEDVYVLNDKFFPHHLLDGGTTPHREICNSPKSTRIKHPFVVLNHPYFLNVFKHSYPSIL